MGGSTTLGSPVVNLPSTAGILLGQFVQSSDFPKGSVVIALTSTSVTLNTNAIATDTSATLQVYTNTPIPVAVIQMYLNLATASLMQCRWEEEWFPAIGLFIAHYCTIYAQTDAQEVLALVQASIHGEVPTGTVPGTVFQLSAAPPNGTLQGLFKNGVFQTPGVDYTLFSNTITTVNPITVDDTLWATWPINTTVTTPVTYSTAQIAAQGIANGIMTSKSVGDVSASYNVLSSLEMFGAWNLTKYGQLLSTMARVVGSGPMCVW